MSLQYYDWENNFCHHLDWMNDNSITEIESDTEIPSEIDPSQMSSFPEFEPQKLKDMVYRKVLHNITVDSLKSAFS